MGNYEKEHGGNGHDYIYDAFISYRHMPLDKAVAERLQVLLENFRLQKKAERLRIFRDQSELTTSNDLGGEIRKALLHSRYLIVVCSEYTKESAWCMEEIRLFKEAHQGSTRRILTLIISGEPSQVLPDSLRWEERPVTSASGPTSLQREYLEPLSADVRASTRRKSLHRLKVEFLRIAAPILDCGFDELFQRRQRRQRRNAIILFAGSLTLLACILIIVSAFAYRTKISETNYRNILVDNYAREGNRYANAGKPQEALLYYTQALALDPGKVSASSGAALLLQEYSWPVLEENGIGEITDLSEPLPIDCSALPGLEEASGSCAAEDVLFDNVPCALAVGENKVIAAHNGLVHLYAINGKGTAQETARADLAEAFPVDAAHNGISRQNEIRLSRDGSLALISSYSLVALYDTDTLTLKAAVTRYLDGLTGMDISADNRYFVLSYGNPYRINLMNPGGCFEVYSCSGELCFASPQNDKEALSGTAFHPTAPGRVLVWGTDFIQLWDWQEGHEIMAPLRKQDISSVGFTDDGMISVTDKDQYKWVYSLTEFLPPAQVLGEDEGILHGIRKYYLDAEGPDGMTLAVSTDSLSMMDETGTVLDTVNLPAAGQRVALAGDYRTAYLYHENFPALMTIPVDFDSGELGEVRRLDTGTEAVLGIWFGEDWLACETTSRNLLLFDQNGSQICRILPQHNGNIKSVLVDSQMRYVICILEYTIGNPHEYYFSKTGIIEIWDISSQLMLSSFQKDGKEIDRARITENGTLVWSTDDNTYTRRITFPVPDQETIRFMQQTGCLALDSNQEIVMKNPTASKPQMAGWSELGKDDMGPLASRQSLSGQDSVAASKEAFIYLVKDLYGAEDRGDAQWYEQCDALWKRLLQGELDYTAQELDTFYLAYITPVLYNGSTDKIRFGLEAYISLIQGLVEESVVTRETVLSDFPVRLLETLAATQEYDETIIQAFHDISRLNADAETPVSAGDDMDAFLAHMDAVDAAYLAEYLEAWSESLKGNGLNAMSSLAEYCLDNRDLLPLLETEPSALVSLYQGDSQAAAISINRFITDSLQMFGETDTSLLKEQMISWLFSGELLVWRGEIDASVFDEYLRGIDADFGVKIQETTPQAQHAGLLPGDLVIAVDGMRVAGIQHYNRLRDKEAAQDFEILRNGETLTLTISGPVEFAGDMAVFFSR